MNNTVGVKCAQSLDKLSEDVPYLFLFDKGLEALGLSDLCIKITSISALHNNVKTHCVIIEKCFLVADDIFMINARQNSNLIQCILLLFLTELCKFDLFHCVDLTVRFPLDLVDF